MYPPVAAENLLLVFLNTGFLERDPPRTSPVSVAASRSRSLPRASQGDGGTLLRCCASRTSRRPWDGSGNTTPACRRSQSSPSSARSAGEATSSIAYFALARDACRPGGRELLLHADAANRSPRSTSPHRRTALRRGWPTTVCQWRVPTATQRSTLASAKYTREDPRLSGTPEAFLRPILMHVRAADGEPDRSRFPHAASRFCSESNRAVHAVVGEAVATVVYARAGRDLDEPATRLDPRWSLHAARATRSA